MRKNVVLYFSIKLNFIKFEDSPLLLDCELMILWGQIFLLFSEMVVVADGFFLLLLFLYHNLTEFKIWQSYVSFLDLEENV